MNLVGPAVRCWLGTFIVMASAIASPAVAQQNDAEAIDRLIDATVTTDGAIALAREQAGGGDLTGAAATLERALLDRPGAASDPVRLYYASVLCRLDDRRRALYQAGNVSAPDAPGWTEVRQACGEIAPPTATAGDGVAGEVSVGLAYDGDTYGALATQIDLPAFPNLADDGLSATAAAAIRARFGSRGDDHGYAEASFLTKNSLTGPRLDFQVGSVRAGYATRITANAGLSLGGVVRHARLLGDPFFTEYGGQISLGLYASPTSRVAIDVETVQQHYAGLPIQSVRNGLRYDLAASYQSNTTNGRSFVAGIAFEVKDARTRSLGYRGGRLFVAAQLPVGDAGAYAALSGTARYVDYLDPPIGADLKEWRLFLRGGVGVPLGPKGLFVEAAANYTARAYNRASTLRDYGSVGAELRLVFRFGK